MTTTPKKFKDHPRRQKGRIVTPKTATLVRNIETILDLATVLEYDTGLDWYRDANIWATTVGAAYGYPVDYIARITAILSPQADWPTNKRNVKLFLQQGTSAKILASGKQKVNCAAVLLDSYDIPTTALKTYSFAQTITDPSGFQGVVVDRHAIAVAFGYLKASEVSITRSRYLKVAEAYAIVARKRNLSPHQVQAITWVTYKRIVNR